MNKNLLTILGCSGSLTVALLTSSAANASTEATAYKEYVFTAPEANTSQIVEVPIIVEQDFLDCSCSNYSDDEAELSDKEGDLAIANLGCDCAGCRNIVRNMIQEGTLAPIQ